MNKEDKKKELASQLQKRINEGRPIKYSIFKKEDSSLLNKIEKCFGSLSKCAEYIGISKEELVSKYGFSNQVYRKQLEEDEILNRLLYLKSMNKLNTNNMRTQFEDLRLEGALKKKYGSVEKGLSYFGLERDSKIVKYEDLVDKIKYLHSQGEDLSYKNMIANYSPIIHTLTGKLNKSWYESLSHIGIEYTPMKVVKYNRDIVQEKISKLIEEHGEINYSIIRKYESGLLMYVRNNYESIFEFYESFDLNPYECMDVNTQKFKGYLFERLFKEVLDELNVNYEYNKYIDNNKLRPDFILEDGAIIDCKLSSWTSTIKSTIEKYTPHCNNLKIVYLRGKDEYASDLKSDNVDILNIEKYINKISESKRQYFYDKIYHILNNDNFIESVTTTRVTPIK